MSYARFFGLFKSARVAGIMPYADHAELIAEVTSGRTSSLRDLTPQELRAIEQRIQELLDPKEAAAQRMRRKVIGILAGRGAVNEAGRPDMPHILAWVLKYGYLHKELNDYLPKELPQLVTQAERIVASDLKAIRAHHG